MEYFVKYDSMFNIDNRRYVGSKTKLIPWIRKEIISNCKSCKSFCDLFAGTGVVSNSFIDIYDTFYINDFLYSNEIIYKAFFENKKYDIDKLNKIKKKYKEIRIDEISDNYVSKNYGNKFFSNDDAKIIGHIRENIEKKYKNEKINEKEYDILLASLIYSFDKIANTVGHYDAYRKKTKNFEKFEFDLINPIKTQGKKIIITREDSNIISKKIRGDIVFIDPPYNSRQYSRFYHLLETIVKWDKPKLYGTALKPKEENMSDYCRANAPVVFEELIKGLKCKYIIVTYNNTYNSKSSSSKNKITLYEIKSILQNKGKTIILNKTHRFFNAGKSNLENHKEYLFITKVK